MNATARLSKMTYPNGLIVSNSFLPNSGDQRLSQILNLDSTNGILSKFDYTYNTEGEITKWTQQTNSAAATHYDLEYDAINQLVFAGNKNVSNVMLKQYAYGYDKAGNRTSEQIDQAVSAATYNTVNQRTNQVGNMGGPISFEGTNSEPATVVVSNGVNGVSATVDSNNYFRASLNLPVGTNAITIVAKDYGANGGNVTVSNYHVVVVSTGSKTFAYDLNGNLTAVTNGSAVTSYSWDGYDRLLSISTNGVALTSFTYNGSGQRTRMINTSAGVSTTNNFVWCGGTQPCELRNAVGDTVVKSWLPQGMQIGTTNFFYTFDHLGSIREMMTNNVVVARYDYDPYGRRTLVSGSDLADFGYAGMYFHQQTTLNLTLYRAYDSDHGRWLNRDPIAESGGLNLYGYVFNDPINFFDPDGLADVKVNGEIWQTPIKGDAGHPHTYNGVDQGPHMHGPNGQKFFPDTGMIRDKNGNWSQASNKFKKRMDKAMRSKLGRGLGTAGVLAFLSLVQNEASGANCEEMKNLKDEIQRYKDAKEQGDEAAALLSAAGIANSVQNIFQNDIAANAVLGELLSD